MVVDEWIERAWSLGASDLHLEEGTPLVVRVRGELQTLGGVVPGDTLVQAAQDFLGSEGWAHFRDRGSADLSVAIGGVRCRVNFFQTVRGVAAAIRLLAPSVMGLAGCNLHPDFRKLVEATAGLAIISGLTGSGKSTTLAALVEEINGTRARTVLTLESPLEYIYSNRRSFIRQREIPTHSPSFEQGIIDALRENPDVLVVSEMRTAEVMRLTLNAAETGHLVLATMHSANCAEALSRLCMSFPADIQASVRAQLADCLVGVVCQRLEYLEKWQLRVPRCEVLLPNSGARGTIRAGQFGQIANVIQSGGEEGMWTFDRYQRWMEQQREWMRPATPPAVAADGEIVRSAARVAPPVGVAPAGRPAPTASGLAAAPRMAPGGLAGRPGAPTKPRSAAVNPDAPEEITIDEDLNLEDIAELARKI